MLLILLNLIPLLCPNESRSDRDNGFSLFIHPAYAGEVSGNENQPNSPAPAYVSIRDDAGHILSLSQENSVETMSDLTFSFQNLTLPLGQAESGQEEDWIFAAQEIYDQGLSAPDPVIDGLYSLGVTEDTTISFSWFDRISRKSIPVPGIPERIHVIYIKEPSLKASGELSYDKKTEGSDTLYLSGSAPILTVSPAQDGYSYLAIGSSDQWKEYPITEDKTTFTFTEGYYELKLWTVDGRGLKYFTDLPISQFFYDATPPSPPILSFTAADNVITGDMGETITSDSLQINASSSDTGSGLSHYVFILNNNERLEGNSLRLNPDYKGQISVQSFDLAGNQSPITKIEGDIILDQNSPEFSQLELEEGQVRKNGTIPDPTLSFQVRDDLAGLSMLTAAIGSQIFYENDYMGSTEGQLVKIDIPYKLLTQTNNLVTLKCLDRAGNSRIFTFQITMQAPEKEKKKKRDKEDSDEDERNSDEEEADITPPVLSMAGFQNFQVSGQPITVLTGVYDNIAEGLSSLVTIERYDMGGNLLSAKKLGPGSIRLYEEGNYIVRLEAVDKAGNRSELVKYCTLDLSGPTIASFQNLNRKKLEFFSFLDNPSDLVEDYSYTTSSLYLNGMEYDGHQIDSPGRYVLKLTAVDEVGHASEERAEFLIVDPELASREGKPEEVDKDKDGDKKQDPETLNGKENDNSLISENEKPSITQKISPSSNKTPVPISKNGTGQKLNGGSVSENKKIRKVNISRQAYESIQKFSQIISPSFIMEKEKENWFERVFWRAIQKAVSLL
ncbi:MAG: hypothetical protein K5989_07445 [Lachnospiraceae bacterium]|nr:hypothetical protein [Lachnospiraceae bacterium]